MTERVWTRPHGDDGTKPSSPSQLLLYNSLVDRKVPFVPVAGPDSKHITWYTCGPTVYDSTHMGHARNYLAFDVVRRVLEDYFGYSILYVMNVTDVDDKIILRARRNYLLKQYLEDTSSDIAVILADAKAALAAAEAKQRKKVEDAAQALAEVDAEANGSSAIAASDVALSTAAVRRKEGLTEAAAQEDLLLSKIATSLADIHQIQPATADLQTILDLAGDALAAHLDQEKGSTVTDPGIFRAHAARYEKAFLEDMDTLGVRPPTVLTRVSEYIDEIIEYVQKIVDNGMAYSSCGSVYFDTQAFISQGHTYGKLNPWAVGSALSAEPNEPGCEKKHPCDFALWKTCKPGEPKWQSPWGEGRPGWHIECSAMASSIIGTPMDIHTGGEDLRFPHHDNELAQAEAHYHCQGCTQWVNYFLHSGHLGIEGLKMSKSLKNFITIRYSIYICTFVLYCTVDTDATCTPDFYL